MLADVRIGIHLNPLAPSVVVSHIFNVETSSLTRVVIIHSGIKVFF